MAEKNNVIYLDNAASTQPFPEVVECMNEINEFIYGNSSSVHFKGIEAHRIIKDSTDVLADFLNCSPEEIIFTSGGSESNNTAVKGLGFAVMGRGGNMVTSAFEHPTVLNAVKSMGDFGFEIRICGLNEEGCVCSDDLIGKIDSNTRLVSIMAVNSETGAKADLGEMSDSVKGKNNKTVFHTDAVQAFGKYKLDMNELKNIDMLSASSHKIKGPKGVGLLYIRKGLNIKPLLDGGGHQGGRRSGTENTAGIAGFAAAAGIYKKNQIEFMKKARELNEYLRQKLLDNTYDIRINSPREGSPYILNAAFRGIMSETLLNHLSGLNICVSAGSACSSKKKSDSHVLSAMKVPGDYIGGAVRISFEPYSQKEDLDTLVKEIKAVLPILRRFGKR